MGDERKLEKLKRDFLGDLKVHSFKLCLSHKSNYMKCKSESMLNHCGKFLEDFDECAKRMYEELKEENKEILEFKINPDS